MTSTVTTATRATAIPVRYRILGLLFVLSFVNYFLRNNFSVALPTHPAGVQFLARGDRLDSRQLQFRVRAVPDSRRRVRRRASAPRRALTIIAVTWGVLTALTGFLPGLMAASAQRRARSRSWSCAS